MQGSGLKELTHRGSSSLERWALQLLTGFLAALATALLRSELQLPLQFNGELHLTAECTQLCVLR